MREQSCYKCGRAQGALLQFLTFVLALFGAPASAGLREDVETLLQQQELAGAVWSTVDPEGVIATDAAGLKDARSGAGITVDDRVHVGSIAKTLVATGVLRLVSEGRLALDAPLSELLPGIDLDNPWAATDPVRVRHLIDHTAGMDDAHFWQVFSLEANAHMPLAQAFEGDASLLRLRSRPGSRFSYSNMSNTLAAMVIEAVAGERYERYLERALLAPLAMRDSTFAFVSQEGPHADPRLAMGHFEHRKAHAAVALVLRPAVQFTTTARDMGRFARFLMSDGRVAGAPLVDPALLRAMGQPVGTEAALAGLRVGNGLGLFTRDRHGAVGRCHGGSTVGYRAMLCIFPDAQRAFFMAHNADSESADYDAFDRLMIQSLRLPAMPPPTPAAPMDIAGWTGWYVPAPNRFASFAWLDTVFGFVRVSREGAGLRFAPLQGAAVALAPMGGPLFRAPGRTIASHVLVTSSDGKRVISTGTQSYERIPPLRLLLLWSSLALGVAGFAWVLLSGLVRLLSRRMNASQPVVWPLLGIAALLLPLPFLLTQSFLQLGDLTPGSGLLALVTLALPLAMLAGLFLHFRRRPKGAVATLDALAMAAVLQLTLVLAVWGLIPLRLWA